MHHVFRATVLIALVGCATSAQADIIFSLNQGSVQPDENVLYNCSGLAQNATTVQGCTNQTQTLVNISSNEALRTNGGQARVESADQNGFSFAFIDVADPTRYFGEFEANINIANGASGTATINACNQFGSFGGASLTPSGACESFEFQVGNGNNFFVLSVADGQLLNGVRIALTGTSIVDLRQIRIGDFATIGTGTGAGQPIGVPEPGSMVLLGVGLLGVAARMRRRKTA